MLAFVLDDVHITILQPCMFMIEIQAGTREGAGYGAPFLGLITLANGVRIIGIIRSGSRRTVKSVQHKVEVSYLTNIEWLKI